MEDEIAEQPVCLARLLSTRAAFESVAAVVRRFDPQFVVTAARGSSDNAARYAKYLFGIHNRLIVSLGAPSVLTLYHSRPNLRGALILGISQSGQSPDITDLLIEGRRQGALTVTLTNAPDSPLGQAAEYVLPLAVGTETSVAATKSYTGQLMALAMLSTAIADDSARWAELDTVPAAVQETCAQVSPERLAPIVHMLRDTERMLVVGRGFHFATAFEIGLKLKETAYLSAESYAAPDLMHGPIAIADGSVPCLLIAAHGPAFDDLVTLASDLRSRGAPVLAVADDPARFDMLPAGHTLTFSRVPEWLSPIPAIIPGQLLACVLSRSRGYNPDRPRGLAKITKTH